MSNLFVMRDANATIGLNNLLNDFFFNKHDLVMA